MSVPNGLTPQQASNAGDVVTLTEPVNNGGTIWELIQEAITELTRLLNGGVNPLRLTKDAIDDTVFVEFTYEVDSLPAGGTAAFEFELVVQPEFAGVFVVEGSVENFASNQRSDRSFSQQDSSLVLLTLQVNDPAAYLNANECISRVNINIRSTPNSINDSNKVQVFDGHVYLNGRYIDDPDWYRVGGYYDKTTHTRKRFIYNSQELVYAWVGIAGLVNQGDDLPPCNQDNQQNGVGVTEGDDLPLVDDGVMPTATPFTPTPTPTPGTGTPMPTATPGPQGSYEEILARDYGVLLRSEPGYPWIETEINEIYAGVVATATAFGLLSNRPETDAELFKIIMTQGDVLPYIVLYKWVGSDTSSNVFFSFDVTNPLNDTNVTVSLNATVFNGGCLAHQGTGSNNVQAPEPRILICNSININSGQSMLLAGFIEPFQANRPFTQYALVHELGHFFTERSKNLESANYREKEKGLLYAAVANTKPILDDTTPGDERICSPAFNDQLLFSNVISTCRTVADSRGIDFVVMGVIGGGEWRRGVRGWGTSVASGVFTDFQQHPQALIEEYEEDDSIIIDEAAADMFLNWVYRKVTDPLPEYRTTTQVPEPWVGFANIDINGDFDRGLNSMEIMVNTYSGDARMEWMDIVMSRIFELKGWLS